MRNGIGMAAGAYEVHVNATRERVRAAYLGEKSVDDPFAQVRIATAAADIDTAWWQLEKDINDEWEHAVAGTKIPVELRLRARRDQVLGSARAISAIDRLFESAGGKAIKKATKPKLKLTKKLRGKRIKVMVIGVKAGYATLTRTSKATGKVKR